MVVAVASLVLLAVAAAASADQGGMTISSAPELPLGRSVASTVPASATLGDVCATHGRSGELWRVSMNAFDHFVIDFKSTNGDVVGINMIAPTVTDATLSDAENDGRVPRPRDNVDLDELSVPGFRWRQVHDACHQSARLQRSQLRVRRANPPLHKDRNHGACASEDTCNDYVSAAASREYPAEQ